MTLSTRIFSLFSVLLLQAASAFSQPLLNVPVVEKYVVGYNDVTRMKFINDSVLYAEGWHNLPQPQFWQQVMNLSPDSAIVNVASSRRILDKVYVKKWSRLSDAEKNLYRDSIRKANGIADSVSVLVTIGKKDFYEFKKVMPTINRSIDVFKQHGVDP